MFIVYLPIKIKCVLRIFENTLKVYLYINNWVIARVKKNMYELKYVST